MIDSTRWHLVVVGLVAAVGMGPWSGRARRRRAPRPRTATWSDFFPTTATRSTRPRACCARGRPRARRSCGRSEIGWGKSAVVEAGGLAFTAAEIDDKQWAVCLDPATGATRWKHLLLPEENRHFARGR